MPFFRLLGLGKSVKSYVTGKITLANKNELSANQITTTKLIVNRMNKQMKALQAMEQNLNECKRLMSHYQRDVAAGAIVEGIDLLMEDIKKYLHVFGALRAAFDKYKWMWKNIRNSKDVAKYKKQLIATIKEFEREIAKDRKEMLSQQAALRSIDVAGKEIGKYDLVEARFWDRCVNMPKRLEQTEKLVSDLRKKLESAERDTTLLAAIKDLGDNALNVMKEMETAATSIMNVRIDPKKAKFKVTDDITKMASLILVNYNYIVELVEGQKFFLEKGSYVGVRVGRVEPQLKTVASRVSKVMADSVDACRAARR